EFGCGLLVTIGFLTRLSVIPIIFNMCIAYFIAHTNDPFEKKEIVFMFIGMGIIVFVLGSGKYSLDNLLFKHKPKLYA
ncbi:MAG: DoxX family protein, partial [Bacteroidota bacterium]